MELSGIFLVAALLMLAFQDFKSRSVYWFYFPVIFFVMFFSGLEQWPSRWMLLILCSNLLMIILQLSGIWIYLKFTKKNSAKFLDHYLGLGDILLLVAISPGFIPLNFIFFITCITLSILIIYTVIGLSGRIYNPQIPLAGFLSVALLLIFSVEAIMDINLRYYDLQLFFI